MSAAPDISDRSTTSNRPATPDAAGAAKASDISNTPDAAEGAKASDISNMPDAAEGANASVQCRGERFTVYIDRETIRRRVAEIGADISVRYAGKNPVFVGVLQGACIFLADLLRTLTIDCEVDFCRLSSYEGGKTSSGRVVEQAGAGRIDLAGRHVIVVEDIVDTGRTMAYLMERIEEQGAASVRIATLVHKPDAACVHVGLDYVGFEAPNRFLIGYGMDYKGAGRNLPDIYVLVEGLERASG